ncbi:MAG: signal peptidase I [Mobilitalea sp.]
MNNKIVKEIISWITMIIIAVVLSMFINKFIIMNVEVPTGSMVDTINIDDKVSTFRLAYTFSDPERGDIVVFPYPDDESIDYIKRIIGLPGETIEGKDGYVYIDGVKLIEDDYVMDLLDEDFGPYEIPEGSCFMMGDNRLSSEDARGWTNKFVSIDKIKGKAIFTYPRLSWLW